MTSIDTLNKIRYRNTETMTNEMTHNLTIMAQPKPYLTAVRIIMRVTVTEL